jgi:hypothetical protein
MTTTFTPPIHEQSYHWPLDQSQAANRRKTWALTGLFLLLFAAVSVVLALAFRPPKVYVLLRTREGDFLLSSPEKNLDLHDMTVQGMVGQDLLYLAARYFSRSAVTAQRDYDDLSWFIPDQIRAGYDAAATGPKGWIHQLQTHQIPEVQAIIHNVVMTQEDVAKSPYRARIFVERRTIDGKVYRSIAIVTFIVDPHLVAGKLPWSLYNGIGLFLVKQPEEFPDLENR